MENTSQNRPMSSIEIENLFEQAGRLTLMGRLKYTPNRKSRELARLENIGKKLKRKLFPLQLYCIGREKVMSKEQIATLLIKINITNNPIQAKEIVESLDNHAVYCGGREGFRNYLLFTRTTKDGRESYAIEQR